MTERIICTPIDKLEPNMATFNYVESLRKQVERYLKARNLTNLNGAYTVLGEFGDCFYITYSYTSSPNEVNFGPYLNKNELINALKCVFKELDFE